MGANGESTLRVAAFGGQAMRAVFGDVSEEEARQPCGPGRLTILWQCGHLAWAAGSALALLGGGPPPTKEEADLFARGTTFEEAKTYPTLARLVALLEERRAALAVAHAAAPPQVLAATNPRETMRDLFPTVGDMLAFLMTGHEWYHLAQVAECRRHMGKKPLGR